MTPLDIEEAAKRILPGSMIPGTMRYILYGIPMGSFGTAVFSNDLLGALQYADDANKNAMFLWASFLRNYAPGRCYSSPAAVKAWCEKGGMRGEPL